MGFQWKFSRRRRVLGNTGPAKTQRAWLHSVGAVVSRLIGVEQFAVEGYFDPRSTNRVVVVDMNLPLDIAWNTSRDGLGTMALPKGRKLATLEQS